MNANEYNVDYRSEKEKIVTTSGPMKHRIATFPEENFIKHHNKKLWRIFASVLSILAALCVVLFLSLHNNGQISTTSQDKNLFEQIIAPLVMQDPPEFHSISEVDSNILLTASVWKASTNPPLTEFNEEGLGVLPLEKVKTSYENLFESIPDTLFDHDTTAAFFKFDSAQKLFFISPYSNQSSFIPYIEKIKTKKDKVELCVWYVSPNDPWRSLLNNKPHKPNPEKQMIYTLKKSNQNYYIKSVLTATNG